MHRSGSRVLAGLVSIAVGGVFVAASAIGVLADSPAPASLNLNHRTFQGADVLDATGTLQWGGKCPSGSKIAAVGIAWRDSGDPGYPVPGGAGMTIGDSTDGNLSHPSTGCSNGAISYAVSHTYKVWPPTGQVCAVAYDVRAGQTDKPFHSIYEGDNGAQPGNTDNSLLEPSKGGFTSVCKSVVAPPVLGLSKTANPASGTTVARGQQIDYTLTYSNTGSSDAANVTVTDAIPTGTTYKAGSAACTAPSGATCSSSFNNNTVSYAVSNVAAGRSGTATFSVTVNNSARDGQDIDNVGQITFNGSTTPSNHTHHTVASTPPPPQNITVHKTATPRVNVGEQITYTLAVTNNSASTTNNTITVTDPLPGPVTYVSASGTNWQCQGGQNLTCTWTGLPLASGASTTAITVLATAKQTAVPSVTNTAQAHMGNITVQDAATTIVGTPVNLTLGKTADPVSGSDVSRGEQIDYTLHYANTGTTDANNVTITDAVPTGTSYVTGSAACSTTCTPSFNGSTVSWSLNIPANSAGVATFSVKVDSDAFNGEVINNVAYLNYNGSKVPSNHTRHFVFVPKGDLKLHKSVTPTKATVGTVLHYTLTASASGNINQTGVEVTDAIPDGTTYQTGSAACASPCVASYDSSADTVTWDVGTMHPGDKVSMTFDVKVDGPVNGTLPTEIDNVGQIRSHESPPEPSNRVVVPVTVVLGEKIVNTPTPPATALPFTGFDVVQNALLALVLIGGGLVILTWPRLQPAYRRMTYSVR